MLSSPFVNTKMADIYVRSVSAADWARGPFTRGVNMANWAGNPFTRGVKKKHKWRGGPGGPTSELRTTTPASPPLAAAVLLQSEVTSSVLAGRIYSGRRHLPRTPSIGTTGNYFSHRN